MTDEKQENNEEEFTIKPDTEKPKRTPMIEFVKATDQLFECAEKIEHLSLQQKMLGLTERIFKEDRDASNLFCNKNRRCELHGIMCVHPQCYICSFADMQTRPVCAVMDNLDGLYKPRKKWGMKDAKAKKDSGSVPKDIQNDTAER